MADPKKKVETVKREMKKKEITLFHVYVGGQPVRTTDDSALAQHIAIDEKAKLIARGCDVTLKEFTVTVEEETKEQEYFETVKV